MGVDSLETVAKEINKPIKLSLSFSHRVKLIEIERQYGLSTKEAMAFLIDFYYLEEPYHLRVAKTQILSRIAKGVNGRFLLQLKLIYIALGHFLKRIRYI